MQAWTSTFSTTTQFDLLAGVTQDPLALAQPESRAGLHRAPVTVCPASGLFGLAFQQVTWCGTVTSDSWDGETGPEMRDSIALFDVDECMVGRAHNERRVVAIQVWGGVEAQAYRRGRARTVRATIAEVYSHPKMTAAARRRPKCGLEPGLAFELKVNDFIGQPLDLGIKEQGGRPRGWCSRAAVARRDAGVHRFLSETRDQSCTA